MPERPPKEWFEKMKKRVKKQYPGRSEESIDRIVAGIWHKQYSKKTKERLTRRYESRKRTKKRPRGSGYFTDTEIIRGYKRL